jgi:hypothetical protein
MRSTFALAILRLRIRKQKGDALNGVESAKFDFQSQRKSVDLAICIPSNGSYKPRRTFWERTIVALRLASNIDVICYHGLNLKRIIVVLYG